MILLIGAAAPESDFLLQQGQKMALLFYSALG
jgi:hypothetical protein